MNMFLVRSDFVSTGIFGELSSEDGSLKLYTLEHAFPPGPVYAPALPAGAYLCKRGVHELTKMGMIETFEVTNVPGHTGILFHPGNTNKDSDGCILLGLFRSGTDSLMQSRAAFRQFMDIQAFSEEFTLTVI